MPLGHIAKISQALTISPCPKASSLPLMSWFEIEVWVSLSPCANPRAPPPLYLERQLSQKKTNLNPKPYKT